MITVLKGQCSTMTSYFLHLSSDSGDEIELIEPVILLPIKIKMAIQSDKNIVK